MLKRYCKGFYRSVALGFIPNVGVYPQRNTVAAPRGHPGQRYWLTAYCLLFTVFIGCAGGQIERTEIKTLPWQTYLFNKERQGRTEDTLILPLRFSASFMIAGAPVFKFFIPYKPADYSSPAIVDNTVYVGAADKYFYAVDLLKGGKIWEFKTTGAVESSPTVSGGRVYFGTGNGILYCLNTKDGHEIWRFQAKAEIISSPVVEGGVVYFNSADDKIYALNAETGEKLWQYGRGYVKRVVKRMFASAAIYADKIYCSFTDGYTVALEKSSGREVWGRKTGDSSEVSIIDSVRFTPTIDNGLIYLINGDGFVTSLDAKNGEDRWRFDLTMASNFAVTENRIFVAGYDGSIIAIKKGSGEIVWRSKVSAGVPVSVIAAANYLMVASNYKTETLFFSSAGSSVDIFTIDNGKKVWNENIDSTTSTSLAAAYNHLFLVTDNGYLRIYKSSQ